jgi:tRNA-specific 2-thiouridylase
MTRSESKKPLVAVAMSGGVDSSLAALLLHQQGYPVVGMSMKLWDFSEVGGDTHPDGRCCSLESLNDARAVCQQIGIPHYVVDMREDFRKQVILNFIDEYLRGRTPNPCIICNAQIKWNSLWRKARSLGAACMATGHYARVRFDQNTQRYSLLKGVDSTRDQSYALWGLSQTDLSRTIFPLGELTKRQVRAMAREHGLKVAEREESQEICFVADDDYGRFIREWVEKDKSRTPGGIKPGSILNLQGEKLGEHDGIPFYTVGQRKGLGIAAGKPLYVVRLDPEENAIYDVNWIALNHLENEARCDVKIRYQHTPKKAVISRLTNGRILVKFDKPERAITPGQSAVFYDGESVLGGGVIDKLVEG